VHFLGAARRQQLDTSGNLPAVLALRFALARCKMADIVRSSLLCPRTELSMMNSSGKAPSFSGRSISWTRFEERGDGYWFALGFWPAMF
jgi:hypothetical protein